MTYVSGPLLVAERAEHVAYDELVEVVTPDGQRRRGQVLEIDGRPDGRPGARRNARPRRRLDRGARPRRAPRACRSDPTSSGGSSTAWAGPIDGGPPLLPEAERDLNGLPVNPVARAHPAEFIETGISAIDGLHTLVRGQKLPVFSGYGLPGLELAARIARERARAAARTRGSSWSSPRSA